MRKPLPPINDWEVTVSDMNGPASTKIRRSCRDVVEADITAEELSDRFPACAVRVTNGGHLIRIYEDGKCTYGQVVAVA